MVRDNPQGLTEGQFRTLPSWRNQPSTLKDGGALYQDGVSVWCSFHTLQLELKFGTGSNSRLYQVGPVDIPGCEEHKMFSHRWLFAFETMTSDRVF